jgi:hypothetical protein
VRLVVGKTAHNAGGGDDCERCCRWGRLRTRLVVGMTANNAGGGYDCSSRFPLPVYYYILQRYLAHVKPPSALVCALTPQETLCMTSHTSLSKSYASPTSVLLYFPLHSVHGNVGTGNILQWPALKIAVLLNAAPCDLTDR